MGRLAAKFRKAIITGASSGLGLAFAKMLIAEGVSVVGLSRKPESSELGEGYQPVVCDLSDVSGLDAILEGVFQEHDDIDLVINNAGFGILSELSKVSDGMIEQQYAVMLISPTLLAKRALRAFEDEGRKGCIVNVSSLAAELPLPLMPVYNACKSGLSGLSDSLILDQSGGQSPVTVIDFRPGDFRTDFSERMEGQCYWNEVDLREVMDRHHRDAPSVDLAVRSLQTALEVGKSGRFRTGDFFQARVAPLGARFFPFRFLKEIIRCYYRT